MSAPTANISKTYTMEEYLSMEEKSLVKHHFINGEIIAMPGGTYNHNLIATNLTTALNNAIAEKEFDFHVLNSDMKVFISRTTSFVYPDAIVICSEPEFYSERKDIITNPLLIVEVLSPSTSETDRGTKFYDYKRIPGFKEYVLVEQANPFITSSFKTAERTWTDTEAEGLETAIYLQSIDCTIDLKKIYKGMKF